MLGRIPNYLRTTTNKYKGLITEKVATIYLRKKGFICIDFMRLILLTSELRRENMEIKEFGLQKIRDLEEELRRDLKNYSSKSPPKAVMSQFQVSGKKWEEFRKEKLTITRWRLENLPKELKEEMDFLGSWEEYFEPIENYRKWLRKQGHYRPDLIAKRGNKVFIVEVKSQTKGKTALFGEHQRKALLKAYEFGLTPMLLIVPFDVTLEIGEPQLMVGREYFTTG